MRSSREGQLFRSDVFGTGRVKTAFPVLLLLVDCQVWTWVELSRQGPLSPSGAAAGGAANRQSRSQRPVYVTEHTDSGQVIFARH